MARKSMAGLQAERNCVTFLLHLNEQHGPVAVR